MRKKSSPKPVQYHKVLALLAVVVMVVSVIIVLRSRAPLTVELVDEEGNIIGEASRTNVGKYMANFRQSQKSGTLPTIVPASPSPSCGNAKLESGEQCDLGSANSNAPNAACRIDCSNRRCGDGVTDTNFAELCDDGNTADYDGCGATCKCIDNDGGNYPNVRGAVTVPLDLLYTDFCSDNTLQERVCAQNSNDASGDFQYQTLSQSCQYGCSPELPGELSATGAKCN